MAAQLTGPIAFIKKYAKFLINRYRHLHFFGKVGTTAHSFINDRASKLINPAALDMARRPFLRVFRYETYE